MLSDDEIAAISRKFGHWNGVTVEMNDVGIEQFARAIEAEVRKDDTELIRQMLEVLEYVRNTPEAEYDSKAALSKAQAAITAGRARLEGTP